MNIEKEVAALERMAVRELRLQYAEVFGEQTRAGNKPWLIKRIVWRLQSIAEGDLSERARRRAAELANDADVRLSPPTSERSAAAVRPATDAAASRRNERLPLPGTMIARPYKGQTLQVEVLSKGFAFQGEVYKSLSAVAGAITGQHCNGYHFFRLGKESAR
ncbi:MAG TPA: DUF2924 domain-containing protein [Pirellulales bacterium]|nr:DUF2924 domain-containing protein [Pirellulales bacterium]